MLIHNQPSQRVLDRDFRLVNLTSAPHLHSAIERVVNSTLVPLYGEQSAMLADIKKLSDCRCEVLLKKDEAVGFIIYKSELVSQSLQLCHLELMNPRDAGAGYRSQLYDRVEEIAKERLAKTIQVTVANRDPLRNYLLDRNFKQDANYPPDTKAGRPATTLYYSPGDEKKTPLAEPEGRKRVRVETRQVTLPRQYIHQIKSGAKTIEGRINSGQFKQLKTGERIRFFYQQNPNDDVTCEITALKPYKSFPEMLTAEGYKKCVPELTSYQAACLAYDRIPGYTAKAELNGVVAIHIKVVS